MSQVNAGSAAAHSTLTAYYDRREDAEKATRELQGVGLAEGSIRLHPEQGHGDGGKPADHHGFLESIAEFFFPDDDRHAYAEGMSRGGYVVTVTAVPSSLQARAIDILDDAGSVDVDQRTAQWRTEGWTSPASGEPVSRLGASDHLGQPRAYAESAVGALATDPLPTRHDAAIGRGRARAYVTDRP